MSRNWTFILEFFADLKTGTFIRQSVMLLPCVLLLSACGPITAFWTNDGFLHQNNDVTEQTAETSEDISKNGDELVNINELFSDDIRDPLKRIKRVESAVVDLNRKLDSILPSMSRIDTLEDNIQNMFRQLNTLIGGEYYPSGMDAAHHTTEAVYKTVASEVFSTAPPTNLMPDKHIAPEVVVYKATQPNNATTTAITGTVTVKKLRLGLHKNTTRIVLDVSGPAAYHYDLDNNEHLLIIELPNAGWSGLREWSSRKAPLLSSYSVQPLNNNAGSRVIIQLKHNTRIVYETTLPANGFSDYRIVLDLAHP